MCCFSFLLYPFIIRRDSDSSSESEEVLPENALEVEKNVIASAVKNNLDDVSVKRILKVQIVFL